MRAGGARQRWVVHGHAQGRALRGGSSAQPAAARSPLTTYPHPAPVLPPPAPCPTDSVDGVLKPGRLTLLLGTPGSGRSVLMRALAGRLGRERTLKVRGLRGWEWGCSLHGLCSSRMPWGPRRALLCRSGQRG